MNVGTPVLLTAATAIAALATAALFRWRAHLPLAGVNARTLHEVPIPRVGGLAIWAGFLPIALAAPAPSTMSSASWTVPWLLLFIVSLRDDVKSVGIVTRLGVHVVASAWFAIALASTSGVDLPAWGIVIAALVCAWSLNLYNFMDGSDGLAATMALLGFAAYGAALVCRGEAAALPLTLAATMIPVLFVNRPPARMFLGDVGAVPLGFLAAAFGVGGVVGGQWPAWFPVLVFLPFIADATVTLARRMVTLERFWQSHRSHYYQRLHQLGAGHAGTLAVWGALMAGSAGTAVACACLFPSWGPAALGAWCIVHAGTFAAIDYHWRRSARTT